MHGIGIFRAKGRKARPTKGEWFEGRLVRYIYEAFENKSTFNSDA
jgi:hypothetical protein